MGARGVSPALVCVSPTRSSAQSFTEQLVAFLRKNHRRDADGSDRDGRAPQSQLHGSG
jgi:hypothetical protein